MKNLIKTFCSYCNTEYLMTERKKHNTSLKHKRNYKEFQEMQTEKSKKRNFGNLLLVSKS